MSIDLHLSEWLVSFDITLQMINDGTHGVLGIVMAVFIAGLAMAATWVYLSKEKD